jgi:hypothetical protein
MTMTINVEILVGVVLFILGHAGVLIWFLSSVKTDIHNINNLLIKIEQRFEDYIPRPETEEKLGRLWDKVETLENKRSRR